jgi:hypothetical protein
MLPATQSEIEHVTRYMQSQAPELTVQLVQKVYSETVLNIRHDVWDVHTDIDRWWIITEPMNLYAQEQFPNMDLALTFHLGLSLRIPRSYLLFLSSLLRKATGIFKKHRMRSPRRKRSPTTKRSEFGVGRRCSHLSTRHRRSCRGPRRRNPRRKLT